MHPPLALHKHPDCAEKIQKLQACHDDNPLGKFFGVCNDAKSDLDRCFRAEKAHRRKVNLEAAKASKERLQAAKAAEDAAGVPKWTEILEAKSRKEQPPKSSP